MAAHRRVRAMCDPHALRPTALVERADGASLTAADERKTLLQQRSGPHRRPPGLRSRKHPISAARRSVRVSWQLRPDLDRHVERERIHPCRVSGARGGDSVARVHTGWTMQRQCPRNPAGKRSATPVSRAISDILHRARIIDMQLTDDGQLPHLGIKNRDEPSADTISTE